MTNKYADLLTSQYRDKANASSTVAASTDMFCDIQDVANGLPELYDLDTAEGDQLDAIGDIVGAQRRSYGLDIQDDLYRRIIKAKIQLNHWDGSMSMIYQVWNDVYGGDSRLLIIDNQDMSFDLAFLETMPEHVDEVLAFGNYLVPKPSGVRLRSKYIVPETGKIFAFDIQNDLLDGWNAGQWGRISSK